jgi:hypothetical protein
MSITIQIPCLQDSHNGLNIKIKLPACLFKVAKRRENVPHDHEHEASRQDRFVKGYGWHCTVIRAVMRVMPQTFVVSSFWPV